MKRNRLSQQPLTYDDLLRIVDLIKSSDQFSEFRLKVGEIEVELRRRNAGGVAAPAPRPAAAPAATAEPLSAPAKESVDSLTTEPSRARDARVVRAPMVGTFYRAPEPGAPPFVEVGQSVEASTIVCIIEVMKLMSSIPAGVRGTVVQVLVDDGSPVEADQPLIVVDPQPGPASS
jgi:acetyl-CoA carboxylase biotin carboxyl carrier protein